jgi:hypothetical protein
MSWLHPKTRVEIASKDRIATTDEIRMVLDAERDYLYWIALLITGDPVLANKSQVDAAGLATISGGVFHDWLSRWARYATARVAASTVHDLIVASANQYGSYACEHATHEVLFEDEVGFIHQLDPQQVITELDPFSRTVLVLRGMQSASISNCALLLEVPRRCVIGAYCRALRWLYKKADVLKAFGDSIDPRMEILDGED